MLSSFIFLLACGEKESDTGATEENTEENTDETAEEDTAEDGQRDLDEGTEDGECRRGRHTCAWK